MWKELSLNWRKLDMETNYEIIYLGNGEIEFVKIEEEEVNE